MVGCAKTPRGSSDGVGVTATRQALSTSNGLSQNGLSTNGLMSNGFWSNGFWSNGFWSNGFWSNGFWSNGFWSNGFWSNGFWSNGLTGAAAVPGDTLRSNAYARELLQYIYSCAMPPVTHDATLDPNGGTLVCSPGINGGTGCDDGYTCSPQGTCVIPLTGAVGVGINADGSTWADSGTCDESCQRWVSACVLARTNAYGVHVEISMRAPAVVPPGRALQFSEIQDALKLVGSEGTDYGRREGAYFGNLFATTPVGPAPSSSYSGPATGQIAQTPRFYACAGPDSNVPEITRRFCSSQGDQTVINVPGVCVTTTASNGATETGVCDGLDGTGSIFGCSSNGASTGTHYDEVITVYLKDPIAVCGNEVCEDGEKLSTDAGYCPSDCHPETWAKQFEPDLGGSFNPTPDVAWYFAGRNMSAVAPDGSIAILGSSTTDVDLGGGTLSSNQGYGILAKLDANGTYQWGARFGNTPDLINLYNGHVAGVAIAPSGNITVYGWAFDDIGGLQYDTVWGSTYPPDAPVNGVPVPLNSWALPMGPSSGQGLPNMTQDSDLMATARFDSQGNMVLAGDYETYAQFGSTPALTGGGISDDRLFVLKVSPTGEALWATNPGKGAPLSLAIDSKDDLALVSTGSAGNSQAPSLLWKLCSDGTTGVCANGAAGPCSDGSAATCPDGSAAWTKNAGPNAAYTVVAVDGADGLYASGYYANGQDFGGGPITTGGLPPFLQKFGADGSSRWVKYANVTCPAGSPNNCAFVPIFQQTEHVGFDSLVAEGVSIAFDPVGDVVLGSFGKPASGGGIDFGVGTFPTYAQPNIFLSAYSPVDGQVHWAKQIPTILGSSLLGMAIDTRGHVVISGNYGGSMQSDGRLLVTATPELTNDVASFVSSFAEPSRSDTTLPRIGVGADRTGAPVLTVPKDLSVPATSAAGAVVFFMPPTAIDDGNAGTSVACSPPPNTMFPLGTTVVTCTASDPVGNQSSAAFHVTVADVLAPTLAGVSPPAPTEATGPGGAVVSFALPTATDQVDPQPTVACLPSAGSTFPIGKTTVTCTATDAHANRAAASFDVEVTDTTPPRLTLPGPIKAEARNARGAAVSFAVSATDLVDGSVKPSCTSASGSTFPLGTTSVSCTATDKHGNGATATFTVTVVDTTPPVLQLPTGSILATATSVNGAPVSYSAVAADLVDGTLTPLCSPASGTTFHLGATTVGCTATDAHGNKVTGSFQVKVQYAWSGFLEPLTADCNAGFKVGRAVPVKFRLVGPSAKITNATARLTLAKISSTGTGPDIAARSTSGAAAGNLFRYDSGQYVFNLDTKALSAGKWQMSVDLGDGVKRSIPITLR